MGEQSGEPKSRNQDYATAIICMFLHDETKVLKDMLSVHYHGFECEQFSTKTGVHPTEPARVKPLPEPEWATMLGLTTVDSCPAKSK